MRDLGAVAAVSTVDALVKSGWDPSALEGIQSLIHELRSQTHAPHPKEAILREIVNAAGGADAVVVCVRRAQYVPHIALTCGGLRVMPLSDLSNSTQGCKVVVVYDGEPSRQHNHGRHSLTPAYHETIRGPYDVVELHSYPMGHTAPNVSIMMGLDGYCERLVRRHAAFREGAVIPSPDDNDEPLTGTLSPFLVSVSGGHVAVPVVAAPQAYDDCAEILQLLAAVPPPPSRPTLRIVPGPSGGAFFHPAHLIVGPSDAVLVLDIDARVAAHGDQARDHLVAEVALLQCQFRRLTILVLSQGPPSLAMACFLGGLAVAATNTSVVFCEGTAHVAAKIRRLVVPGVMSPPAHSPASVFLSYFPAFHSLAAAELCRCVVPRPDASVADLLAGLVSKDVSLSGMTHPLPTIALRTLAMLGGPKSSSTIFL